MSTFDRELYMCKALRMDDETVVCGYYYENVASFIDVENPDYEKRLEYPTTAHTINGYTLCRNTGIKLPDGAYLYEWDLVEYGNAISRPEMGIVEWSDYYRSYRIRSSANYSGSREIGNTNIRVIGNVILSKADADKFQMLSDAREGKKAPDVKVECRSVQRLNRLAREHLPK